MHEWRGLKMPRPAQVGVMVIVMTLATPSGFLCHGSLSRKSVKKMGESLLVSVSK